MTSGAYAADSDLKSSESYTIHLGDEYVVTLDENGGSTGYVWYLLTSTKGVQLLKEEYYPSDDIYLWGNSKRVFTFQATECGLQSIRFELLRSWDPIHPSEIRTYSLNVIK